MSAKSHEYEEGAAMPIEQEISSEQWPSRPLDENLERRQPTLEEKEKMDRELVTLGNLMKDSGAWWQVDGALNVSLKKGEYIGTHKDVDVSLLREDIPRLEEHLAERGYGLFLYKREEIEAPGFAGEAAFDKRRTLRRVSAPAFGRRDDWKMRIVAVDDKGEVNLEAELPVIDVAVIERNEDGKALGWRDVIFPDKWLENEKFEFQGVALNLSNPALFVFNKMLFDRKYDMQDLEKYVEIDALSASDLDEVEEVLEDLYEKLLPEWRDEVEARARKNLSQLREWVEAGRK